VIQFNQVGKLMTFDSKLSGPPLAFAWLIRAILSLSLFVSMNGCVTEKGKAKVLSKSFAVPVASSNSIEEIIRTLPPRFFSNCPYADRETMLEELQDDTNEGRLDSAKGWLHYFSDGGYVHGDSMTKLKSFKTNEGQRIAFVHMMKPFNGATPSADHTCVLTIRDGEWIDITSEVMPAWIDRTWHFNPRKQNLIEVGPWADGKHPKLCFLELRWNGMVFEASKVKPRPLWDDIRNEPAYGQN
jgi:hypothetical protein